MNRPDSLNRPDKLNCSDKGYWKKIMILESAVNER